jgi:H+/Cl- antiporter ClcA
MYYLFGGSAGREGIAVQMGASLSDQLAKFYRIEPEERKILLVSGAGAGFGAAIGTP